MVKKENKRNFTLGTKHKHYGEVVMMRIIEGEPYRFFKSKIGVFSMIPLILLQNDYDEEQRKTRNKNI